MNYVSFLHITFYQIEIKSLICNFMKIKQNKSFSYVFQYHKKNHEDWMKSFEFMNGKHALENWDLTIYSYLGKYSR